MPLRLLIIGKLPIRLREVVNHVSVRSSNAIHQFFKSKNQDITLAEFINQNDIEEVFWHGVVMPFSCNIPFTRRQPYCWMPLRLLIIGKLPIRLREVVNFKSKNQDITLAEFINQNDIEEVFWHGVVMPVLYTICTCNPGYRCL
jgi:predicted NAD/FAD-binding protein